VCNHPKRITVTPPPLTGIVIWSFSRWVLMPV
jgi:hypothetical protein